MDSIVRWLVGDYQSKLFFGLGRLIAEILNLISL